MRKSKRISDDTLKKVRNNIPIQWLIAEKLNVTWKLTDEVFRFICPQCMDFNTAVYDNSNLACCFRCESKFNTIDLVMRTNDLKFTQAYQYLRRLLRLIEHDQLLIKSYQLRENKKVRANYRPTLIGTEVIDLETELISRFSKT